MTDRKKFLLLIAAREIPKHIQDTLDEQPARSGMFNWIFAHRGEIGCYEDKKDKLDNYDVVQVNMSPADMRIVPEVSRLLKGSDTKLVLNNDYVCEHWGKWGVDPYYYDQIQRHADMLFGTEPHQVSCMLDGAFQLTHPSNTKMLKRLGTDLSANSVGFLYHWWAGQTYLPSRTLRLVKEKFKVDYARMYGYTVEDDEMSKFRKLMWDDMQGLMPFPQFAAKVQGERCLYDPNPCHTYGRNGVELACWKKPVVGSDRVLSYNMLFPQLACDPFDLKTTMKNFKLALTGTDIVEDMLDEAYEKVEYFSYDNSLRRWNEAFDIAIDRGGAEWYQKHG